MHGTNRQGKIFHPCGSNQDSCMLNGSPSLGFCNKNSEENIDSNSDAEDAAKSGLPEIVLSSSSEDSDDCAYNDDEDASDVQMSDNSSKIGPVDSESEDDEAVSRLNW